MDFKYKYLKYKALYINLKNKTLKGGAYENNEWFELRKFNSINFVQYDSIDNIKFLQDNIPESSIPKSPIFNVLTLL